MKQKLNVDLNIELPCEANTFKAITMLEDLLSKLEDVADKIFIDYEVVTLME